MSLLARNFLFALYGLVFCLMLLFFGGAVDFSLWTVSVASIFLLLAVSAGAFFDADLRRAFDGFFCGFNFLFGCIFIIYAAVLVLNPELEYVKEEGFSSLRSLNFIKILPSGTASAAVEYNPMAHVVALGAVFCFAFSTLLLVRTRRAVRGLCWLALAAGIVAAAASIRAHMGGGTAILGLLDKGTPGHSGAFVYHGMGNAAFMIVAAMVGLLYMDCFKHRQTPKRVFAELFFAGVMGFIYVAIFSSTGSGGKFFGGVEIVAILLFPLLRKLFGRTRRVLVIFACGAALAAVFAGAVLYEVSSRGKASPGSVTADLGGRCMLWQTTLQMIADGGNYNSKGFDADSARHIIYGRGPTSFIKLAPPYFYNNPQYNTSDYRDLKRKYVLADYPHSSVLTVLFEYGLAGFSILLLWALFYVRAFLRNAGSGDFPVCALVIGIGLVLGYSALDMILENVCVASLTCMAAMAALNYVSDTSKKRFRRAASGFGDLPVS